MAACDIDEEKQQFHIREKVEEN